MTSVAPDRFRTFRFSGPDPSVGVAVVAASSPTAYPGIEACWDLAGCLERAPVSGRVMVVPVLDEAAFLGRSIRPYTSELVARLREIFSTCDAVIDVRGGDLHRIDAHWVASLLPRGRETEGEGYTESVPADFRLAIAPDRPPVRLGAAGLAREMGVAAFIVSSGGIDRAIESGSARITSSILALLETLHALNGAAMAARPGLSVGPRWWAYDVEGPSLWMPEVVAGQRVVAGTPLGAITDIFGDSRHEVRSGIDGWVLSVAQSLAFVGHDPAAGPDFARAVTVIAARDAKVEPG